MKTTKLILFCSALLAMAATTAAWAVPTKYSTDEYVDGTLTVSSYERSEDISSADVEFRYDGTFLLTVYSDRGPDVFTGWWDERTRTTAQIVITEGIYSGDRGTGTAVFSGDRLRKISLRGDNPDDLWRVIIDFHDNRDRIRWDIDIDIILGRIGRSSPDYGRYERYRIDRNRRSIPVFRDYPLELRRRPDFRSGQRDYRREHPQYRPDGYRPSDNRPGRDDGYRPSDNRPGRDDGYRPSDNRPGRPEGNRPPDVRPGRPEGNRPPDVRPGRPEGNRPPDVRPGRPEGNRPPDVRPGRPEGNRPPDVRPGRPEGNRPPDVRPGRPEGTNPPAVRPGRPEGTNPPAVRPDRPNDSRPSTDRNSLDRKEPRELRPGSQQGRNSSDVTPQRPDTQRPPEARPSRDDAKKKDDAATDKDKKNKDDSPRQERPGRR
ncbi:MAG: hypothetical protein ACYC1M_00220 [Armatimonadota bacterium]